MGQTADLGDTGSFQTIPPGQPEELPKGKLSDLNENSGCHEKMKKVAKNYHFRDT